MDTNESTLSQGSISNFAIRFSQEIHVNAAIFHMKMNFLTRPDPTQYTRIPKIYTSFLYTFYITIKDGGEGEGVGGWLCWCGQ
jgi:hypothetical protein